MSSILKAFFGLAWIAGIAFVFQAWIDYEHNPGRIGVTRSEWPADSKLQPSDRNGTLVVFLHPYCPCSQKGLVKLERILAAQSTKPACYFLFSSLEGRSCVETDSENWQTARAIAPDGTQTDFEAREGSRFGATTSGFVVFYDAEGRLRFRGGITSERGGEQSNSFERLLSEAISGSRFPLINTPVFGCPLIECSVR
jgi:hypothetical protein